MNSNLDFLTGGDAKPYRADVIGKGALIQGDCLEVMQWLIDNNVKVDAIITDPPIRLRHVLRIHSFHLTNTS